MTFKQLELNVIPISIFKHWLGQKIHISFYYRCSSECLENTDQVRKMGVFGRDFHVSAEKFTEKRVSEHFGQECEGPKISIILQIVSASFNGKSIVAT